MSVTEMAISCHSLQTNWGKHCVISLASWKVTSQKCVINQRLMLIYTNFSKRPSFYCTLDPTVKQTSANFLSISSISILLIHCVRHSTAAVSLVVIHTNGTRNLQGERNEATDAKEIKARKPCHEMPLYNTHVGVSNGRPYTVCLKQAHLHILFSRSSHLSICMSSCQNC